MVCVHGHGHRGACGSVRLMPLEHCVCASSCVGWHMAMRGSLGQVAPAVLWLAAGDWVGDVDAEEMAEGSISEELEEPVIPQIDTAGCTW